MKVLVDWETDGQDVDLPEIVEVPDAYFVAEEAQERVADYLSDTYGWLVNGWSVVHRTGGE